MASWEHDPLQLSHDTTSLPRPRIVWGLPASQMPELSHDHISEREATMVAS